MSAEAKTLVIIACLALGLVLGALIEIIENGASKVTIVRDVKLSDYGSVVEEAKRITGESQL
jgi:hypothetical protein